MTTSKLAVFYGFGSTLEDPCTLNFKESGVDCLFFRVADLVGHGSTGDRFNKIDKDFSGCLEAEIKSIMDRVGNREINFLVIYAENDQDVLSPIGLDYAIWRNGLFEHLEKPLFISTYLLNHLAPEARVLFLFNNGAFVPLIGQGTYSVSQYAMRMAVNLLSIERPEIALSSALIEDDSLSIGDINKERSYQEVTEQTNVVRLIKFLKWLLLRTENEVFSEQQWDMRDENIRKQFLKNYFNH